MQILWARLLRVLPVDSGGALRTYHHLRQLQARHHLVLASGYNGALDPAYEELLAAEFPGSVPVHLGEGGRGRRRRALGRLRTWRANEVDLARRRPAFGAALNRILDAGGVDVAVCDGLSGAADFVHRPGVPSVLFAHNAEGLRARRQAKLAANPLRRAAESYWARRQEAFEQAAVRRFDHTIAVSREDAAELRRLAGHDRVSAVPTGVDLSEFQPAPEREGGPPLVVFTGHMRYLPNVDAVQWFCREIWPAILRQHPAARFRIVGRAPNEAVRALASSTVEVTGSVPSVAPHLAEATVVVVPLRTGGGTRLKIYEAMATGRMVVSTPIGAEGLDVRPGEDIVFAEGPAAFIRATLAAIAEPARRQAVGAAAARTAAAHDWPAAGRAFEAILERVAGEARRAAPA